MLKHYIKQKMKINSGMRSLSVEARIKNLSVLNGRESNCLNTLSKDLLCNTPREEIKNLDRILVFTF